MSKKNLPSFFSCNQSAKRHVAHATFWVLNVLVLGFATGAIDLAHNDEPFLALMCAISALVMLLPWVFGRHISFFQHLKLSHLTQIEFHMALMMIVSWAGSLGLYHAGWGYDTFAHFTNSALMAIVIITIISACFKRARTNKGALISVSFLLLVISGALVELFEWGGDLVLGTNMYGEAGEELDTVKDFLANIFGFFFGVLMLEKTPKNKKS